MDYYSGPIYRVVFIKKALQDIRGLGKNSYIKVRDLINSLAYNPRPVGAVKSGLGRFKLKVSVGDQDIYYEIDPVALFVIITQLVHH